MNKSDLLKELRASTGAPMKLCLDSLRESGDDLQKAIDLIKIKGQNIVSDRGNKEAAEGVVKFMYFDEFNDGTKNSNDELVAVEINCQTDFAAKSKEFNDFAIEVCQTIARQHWLYGVPFDVSMIEEKKQNLISRIKENVVVRRWWIEETFDTCKVFSYTHSGDKLGAYVSLKAPNTEIAKSEAFAKIGIDLAMQIAAMNPIAVSKDRISNDVLLRQRNIFEEQIKSKPVAAQPKILEGKLNKWYSEVCLLNQESIVYPKKNVEQIIKSEYNQQLGGLLEVIGFIRVEVGEGQFKRKDDAFSVEVSKLSNVPAAICPTSEKGVCNHTHTK